MVCVSCLRTDQKGTREPDKRAEERQTGQLTFSFIRSVSPLEQSRIEPSRQPYPIPGSRYVGGYIGVGLEREDADGSDT